MPTMGSQTQTVETLPSNSGHQTRVQPNNENRTQTPKLSLYEQSREQRIKENLQRMQQLGLKDLSNSLLNSTRHGRPSKGRKPIVTPLSSTLSPSAPVRRSSRLKNATPVTYSEVVLAKNDELLVDVRPKLKGPEGSEVYTEEHEKLLGDTERSWTLFVDGYGKVGRRIYDPINGKTCHQCRQKTLGHRTHCSNCNMVQGQFCGDCLYMRYGEHVLEAKENPNWVCPVCRGICNCSFCRQAKGWAPTGSLYRKISQMGYKSVAHYLIQTRRVQTNIDNKPDTIDQASAKRSLSFPAPELPSKESSDSDDNQPVTSKPQSEEHGLNIEKKENNEYLEPNPTSIHQNSARKSLLFSNSEAEFEKGKSVEINLDFNGQLGFPELDSGKKIDDGFKCDIENESHPTNKEPIGSSVTLDCCTRAAKNHTPIIEPCPDSVAGRLRLRQRSGNDRCHNYWSMGVNDKVVDVKQTVNHVVSGDKLVPEQEINVANDNKGKGSSALESSPKRKKRSASATEHSPDSIAARMKQRRRQAKDHDEHSLSVANESGPVPKFAENASSYKESEVNLKHSTSGTNVDFIARRLRSPNKIL